MRNGSVLDSLNVLRFRNLPQKNSKSLSSGLAVWLISTSFFMFYRSLATFSYLASDYQE